MTTMKKRIIATLTAATLAACLALPAMAVETSPVRVSSYKGSALSVGERSGLIIGPGSTDYTVTSDDSDTIAVEQVLTYWVAVAKAEGTATITAFNSVGERGALTLMVSLDTPVTPANPTDADSTSLTDNMEIRHTHPEPDERGPDLLQPPLHLAP